MRRFNIPKECRDWPLKKIVARFGCSLPTACKRRRALGNKRAKIDWNKVDFHKFTTTELSLTLGVRKGQVSRKRAELAPETLTKFRPTKS